MRTLYLVGESMPGGQAVPFGEGPGPLVDLVPLDPRHGVFPNLVMTPLLSTLHAFHESHVNSTQFQDQIAELLSNNTGRRFNAFSKNVDFPTNPEFTILGPTAERLERLAPSQEIWAVFGYQTIFGLIRWLMTRDNQVRKRQIRVFANSFLERAATQWHPAAGLPRQVPTNMCAQEGYMHRLCALDAPETVPMLVNAIEHYNGDRQWVDATLRKIRAFVPLLHNEAYQLTPYGVGQANFVLCKNWRPIDPNPPHEVYWRIIGRSLMRRLLAENAA
jgi:hypothetical protein